MMKATNERGSSVATGAAPHGPEGARKLLRRRHSLERGRRRNEAGGFADPQNVVVSFTHRFVPPHHLRKTDFENRHRFAPSRAVCSRDDSAFHRPIAP
jgi:hypothetical protein